MTSPRRAARGSAVFPEPLAAKVPEITFMFWVVKILTTCGGEAVSNWLGQGDRLVGAAVEIGLLAIGIPYAGTTVPGRYPP